MMTYINIIKGKEVDDLLDIYDIISRNTLRELNDHIPNT